MRSPPHRGGAGPTPPPPLHRCLPPPSSAESLIPALPAQAGQPPAGRANRYGMRVAVVGGGAIGSLIAYKLSQSPLVSRTLLLSRWEELLDRLRRDEGIIVRDGQGLTRRSGAVRGVAMGAGAHHGSARPAERADVAVVCVKSNRTKDAIREALDRLDGVQACVTVQNGLGNDITIKDALEARGSQASVLQGVTTHGVTLEGAGRVYHAGAGKIYLPPPLAGHAAVSSTLARALEADVETSELAMVDRVWEKLLVNACINPLSVSFRLKNGELLENEKASALLEAVAREGYQIGRAKMGHMGNVESQLIQRPVDDLLRRVAAVAALTASNTSSMLSDVLRIESSAEGVVSEALSSGTARGLTQAAVLDRLLRERRTEVGVINGALVAVAREVGVQAPLNEAMLKLVTMAERRPVRDAFQRLCGA